MSLIEVWEAASASPFQAIIPKEGQFNASFYLLLIALVITGLFGLKPSFQNTLILGLPASLAFGFGAVFTLCAVGVYV